MAEYFVLFICHIFLIYLSTDVYVMCFHLELHFVSDIITKGSLLPRTQSIPQIVLPIWADSCNRHFTRVTFEPRKERMLVSAKGCSWNGTKPRTPSPPKAPSLGPTLQEESALEEGFSQPFPALSLTMLQAQSSWVGTGLDLKIESSDLGLRTSLTKQWSSWSSTSRELSVITPCFS